MEDLAGTQKSEKIMGSHFACLKLTYFPTKIKKRGLKDLESCEC